MRKRYKTNKEICREIDKEWDLFGWENIKNVLKLEIFIIILMIMIFILGG